MTDLALSKHFAKDNYPYIQMGKHIPIKDSKISLGLLGPLF